MTGRSRCSTEELVVAFRGDRGPSETTRLYDTIRFLIAFATASDLEWTCSFL